MPCPCRCCSTEPAPEWVSGRPEMIRRVQELRAARRRGGLRGLVRGRRCKYGRTQRGTCRKHPRRR